MTKAIIRRVYGVNDNKQYLVSIPKDGGIEPGDYVEIVPVKIKRIKKSDTEKAPKKDTSNIGHPAPPPYKEVVEEIAEKLSKVERPQSNHCNECGGKFDMVGVCENGCNVGDIVPVESAGCVHKWFEGEDGRRCDLCGKLEKLGEDY